MLLFKSLPVGLVFLITEFHPASATLVPHAVQTIHEVTVRHTRNLARDLRLAFGGLLVAQPSDESQHVVYCRPGRPGLGGAGGNGTSSSSASPSGTSPARSSSTTSVAPTGTGTPAPSSPWKLTESH
ncbi:hypothetical protein C0992_000894, partial [Termitomyces sp. T32_za158]